MLYNIPVISSVVGLLQWVNEITGYLFGPGVVLAFFAVMLLAFKNFETERAFAASAVMTTVLCFFLMLINMTTVQHLMICSVGVLISMIGLYMTREST